MLAAETFYVPVRTVSVHDDPAAVDERSAATHRRVDESENRPRPVELIPLQNSAIRIREICKMHASSHVYNIMFNSYFVRISYTSYADMLR